MAYFADLQPGWYHPGPYDSAAWASPLLYVGWLEAGQPYETGEVPGWVVPRIHELRYLSKAQKLSFRGLHSCSLCAEGNRSGLTESWLNLFLPGQDTVFLAPGRIDHYITAHSYRPPDEFLRALEKCPVPGGDEYVEAIQRSNAGKSIPRPEAFHRDHGKEVHEIAAGQFSEEVLQAERQRLEELGYARGLPPARFEKLIERLAQQAREGSDVRNFRMLAHSDGDWKRLRVSARTPFEARFATASKFPNLNVRHMHDELGVRTEFDSSGEVEEAQPREVESLLPSDALVEVAFNLYVADEHPDSQLNPEYLQDLRARMTWQNDECNPLVEFVGSVSLGAMSIPVRTYARTRFSARAALVAEFGEDRSLSIYEVAPETVRSPFDLPSDDPNDFVEIASLEFAPELVDQFVKEQLRRQRSVPDEKSCERMRVRYSERYLESDPLDAFTGFVVVGSQRTWVTVKARKRFAAQFAVRCAFTDAHTIHLRAAEG